jgi:3-deoxy-D-manno-octulosonate 8-phosphate phosphatase (KDO 8-P phosphatase)
MRTSLLTDIATRFSTLGGVFLTEPTVLAARLKSVRGLVFDWDGVFNRGVKGAGVASTFSEADSMGTNMLRYGLWRARDALPVCAIITGEANASAELFTEREHFHALYQGVRNKAEAIEQFCSEFGLERDELACVFDDINDLGMVSGCAVRILVRRSSSALLQELAVREGLCDYLTASEADAHAVREAAEMLLGLMGAFDAVVQSRTAVDDDYRRYFAARQAIATTVR